MPLKLLEGNLQEWGKKERDTVPTDQLSFSWSKRLAAAVARNDFIKLLNSSREQDVDHLVIEVEVELPQNPPVPINQFEQILVRVENETDIPKVFAIRNDFPKTTHQNIVPEGSPVWLCLYEDLWEEIKPYITPEIFLERIREWLRRAAVEELHLSDQPLEPFLVTPHKVLIDEVLMKSGLPQGQILVGYQQGLVPLMVPVPFEKLAVVSKDAKKEKKGNFLGIQVSAAPTFTQVVQRLPKDLSQLIALLNSVNIDLERELKDFFREMMKHKTIPSFKEDYLIVFLHLPKSRIHGGVPETHEYWAFYINATIEKLGDTLGVLASASDVGVGYLIQAPTSVEQLGGKKDDSHLLIEPMSPVFTFTPNLARKTSGIIEEEIKELTIGVIGLGALGSPIVTNLARQGYGKWLLIDNDLLLPHNLARHALSGSWIGYPKSTAMKLSLEMDFQGVSNIEEFPVNYLNTRTDPDKIFAECRKKLTAANLILDFSASTAVERNLSFDDLPAPRLSAFLVPSGKYCVVAYEGSDRAIRLDEINQQLMVAAVQNPDLQDIFEKDNKKIQYAGSCRDLSQVISNDWFLGYAGFISRFIKRNINGQDPKLSVFKWEENPECIREIPIPLTTCYKIEVDGWKIRTADHVISLMKRYREDRLPNETGGILLGKNNYIQKIIYVSYILPSPSDSKEWPTAYIRGVKGLHKEVEKYRNKTSDELTYIGEWHSHPKGASVNPSKDDKIALNWVGEFQSSIGAPGLLAILGDEGHPNYLLSH